MPGQKTQLASRETYHVVVRAVGDTEVFLDENDYYRGIFSLYEFNNNNSITIQARRKARQSFKKQADRSLTPILAEADKRKKIVEVMSFCFMPNHIHLMLRQIKDNGISLFMQKLGGGFAGYFNKKYSRKGHLFSNFKAIHIRSDEQLRNCFVYIHVNPTSLIEPGWKENGVKNPIEVNNFLKEKYRWSSYWDYIGKKNFSSVTEREFLTDVMGGNNGCSQAINDWIEYKKEIAGFSDIILE